MLPKTYNTEKDIPDLSGKVFLITGGTAGLGSETIKALSKHTPGHIFFSGRNAESAQKLSSEVRAIAPDTQITFLQGDISSLESVKSLADQFKSRSSRLDVLMCNAGVMALPPGLTKDGYEVQFATNHLGHALLIKHLLPLLQQTAEQPGGDPRIINMTSIAHDMHPKKGIHFDTLKTKQEDLGTRAGASWARYGQSKLANMLYADALASNYPEIKSVSVHPGVIASTGLFTNMSFGKRITAKLGTLGKGALSVEDGAKNQIWAATCSREKLQSGSYYTPVAVKGTRVGAGNDKQLTERLWDWTQKELEGY